tara:strand:+ start:115 stop:318 length:204 start_codon:yes stop_codon:yes gene_type:complete
MFTKALDYHNQAKDIYHSNDDKIEVAVTYFCIAFIYEEQEKLDMAVDAFSNASAIFRMEVCMSMLCI